MSSDLSLNEIKKEWHGSLKAYVVGFFLSLLLTGASFLMVIAGVSRSVLILSLIGLALIQAIVQLLFFLHVGQEAKPRWESLVFYFMVLVVIIIAIGSLWIMFDLNERVMQGMP